MRPKKIISGGYKILKDLSVTHRNVQIASKCKSMDECLEVIKTHTETIRKAESIKKELTGPMKCHYYGVASAAR